MKKLLLAVIGLAAFTTLAADYNYAWKAGEKPTSILNGKVTITYKGDEIKSMNLTPDANGKIIFTGDKMTFTAADNGAYLTNLCNQTSAIVFQNPVEFKGHFRPFQTPTRNWSLLEQKYNGLENFLSDEYDTVVMKGKNIEDWIPLTTLQCKTNSAGETMGSWSNPGNTMKVAVVSRSEGKLTFQFQAEMNETDKTVGYMAHLLKVVKLELFQDGADVKGRIVDSISVWSKTNAQINVGIDVDNLAYNSDYSMSYMGKAYRMVKEPIRTKEKVKSGGYGINTIEFKTVTQPTVFRFEDAVSIVGSFCASAYTRIEVADASKLSAAFGTWPSQFGTVAFKDGSLASTGTSYAGGGSGSLVFESTKGGTTAFYEPMIPNSWKVVASGFRLANLVSASGRVHTFTYNASTYSSLYNIKFTNTEKTQATAQFQRKNGSYIQCVRVKFQEQNGDVLMAAVDASYVTHSASPYNYQLGLDFDLIYPDKNGCAKNTLATAFSSETDANGNPKVNGYGVDRITLNFSEAGSSNAITLTKPCNLGVGAEYVVRGTDEAKMILKTEHFHAYPTNGTVRIANGGQLDMGGKFADVSAGINGGTCYKRPGKPTFVVEKGGLLRQCASYTLGNNEQVILDGGKLQVGVTAGATDAGTYLFGGIVFKNGAEVFPTQPMQAVRVGNYTSEISFAVAGDSPSTNNVAMMLMGQQSKPAQIAFNVKKTGDYAADFVQNADFTVYVDSSEPDKENPIYFTDAQVRKVGDGTMLFNGLYKSAGKLTLQEGVFEIAKESAWTGKATLAFDGGTLKLDKTQDLPKADVTVKNGTLAIASGAAANFGDCSESEWTGTLDIVKPDFARGDVWFAAVPFTGASVKVNGQPAIVDDEGYVVPEEATGSGTKEDPYLIGTYSALEKLRSEVYNGNGYTNKYFKLVRDIDLTGKEWPSAIGPWESRRFCGHFDGDNYAIIGLKLRGQNTQGLFGQILGEPNAKFDKLEDAFKDGELNEEALAEENFTAGIKNIVFENCEIEAYTNASYKTVSNCGVAAAAVRNAYVINIQVRGCKVKGYSNFGGVVGLATGSVLRDLSTDEYTDLETGGPYAGGIVGVIGETSTTMPTAVINCSNGATLHGDIVTDNYYTALGGVVGHLNMAELLLKDCTNVGKIEDFSIVGSATGVTAVGGVIGVNRNRSLIIGCSNGESGEIRLGEAAKADAVGGLVGFGFNTVVQGGFVAGSVEANAKLAVAGLIGRPHSTTGKDNLVTFDGCGLYLTECVNSNPEGVTRPCGAGYSSNCEMLFKNMSYPDVGAMSMAIPPAYLADGSQPQKVTIENPTIEDGGYGVLSLPQGPVTLSLDGGREFYLDGIAVPIQGTLTVQTADGATVAFGDCSEQTWGGTVAIASEDEKTVRFGEGPAALTDEQQAALMLNGAPARLDDDGYVVSAMFSGAGTEADPFLITGLKDLMTLRNLVNAGQSFYKKYFKLMSDIDLSGVANWDPIGRNSRTPFVGVFDGNNKTISNLKANGGKWQGLFGFVYAAGHPNVDFAKYSDVYAEGKFIPNANIKAHDYFAVIKNLTISGAEVKSSGEFAGALAGQLVYAHVSNITVRASSVVADTFAGGVAGDLEGSVVREATVDAESSVGCATYNAGGIVGGIGYEQATYGTRYTAVINVRNEATVGGANKKGAAGGVAGLCNSPMFLMNCVNAGKFDLTMDETDFGYYVGGVVGQARGGAYFVDCANLTEVKGAIKYASGVASSVNVFSGAELLFAGCTSAAAVTTDLEDGKAALFCANSVGCALTIGDGNAVDVKDIDFTDDAAYVVFEAPAEFDWKDPIKKLSIKNNSKATKYTYEGAVVTIAGGGVVPTEEVVPGEAAIVTAANEEEACAKVLIVAPEGIDAEAYRSLFKPVATDIGDGEYLVEVVITEEAEREIQAELNTPEVAAELLANDGSATIPAKPGLYYSVTASDSIDGLEFGEGVRTMATGDTVEVEVPTVESEDCGFFRVLVNAVGIE